MAFPTSGPYVIIPGVPLGVGGDTHFTYDRRNGQVHETTRLPGGAASHTPID